MALPWIEIWCAPNDDAASSSSFRQERGGHARTSATSTDARENDGDHALLITIPHRLQFADDLAERLRRGEETAFSELVRTGSVSFVTFAASIVGSRDVAEDVVQNVLIRVWRLADTLAGLHGKALADYLFRAVRNGALTALRSDARAARAQAALVRARMSDDLLRDSLEDDDILAREVALVRSQLSSLTPHQRAAIALRYGEGMPIARIAQILEISEKGAEQLLVRVRKLLRERVLRAGGRAE